MAKVRATKTDPDDRDTTLNTGKSRTFPTFSVLLSDNKNGSLNLKPFVESLDYEESDDGLSSCSVKITNPQKLFDKNPLFKEKSTLTLSIGYVGLLSLTNKFYIDEPQFKYDSAPVVSLKSKDQSILLGEVKKDQTWSNTKDSDIAIDIALANKMKYDIQDTVEPKSRVTQANEVDIKFLQKRAKLYGYQVYVAFENGGPVLHFHEPRSEPSGINLYYQYGPSRSSLISFNVENQTFQAAPKVTAGGINPLTGEEIKVEGNPKKDVVRKVAVLDREAEDLVLVDRPVEKVVDDVGETDRGTMQRKVDKMQQAGQFTIEATGEVIGMVIKARDIVNIAGVGKHSGPYYIKSVRHKFGQTYTCSFSCRTSQEGKEKKENFRNSGESRRGDDADVTPKPKKVAVINEAGYRNIQDADLVLVTK